MKPWYQQRTLWAGIALVLTGVGELICGESVGDAIGHILLGLGLITGRQAIASNIAATRTNTMATQVNTAVVLDAKRIIQGNTEVTLDNTAALEAKP